MRVLLVNPAPSALRTAGYYRRMLAPMPPIGLAYLAAALEEAQVPVEVFEEGLHGAAGERALADTLARGRHDLVGLSVVTPTFPDVARLVPVIRAAAPGARIVLGNLHADLYAERLLQEGLADVIVHGEGERTLVELAYALEAGPGGWDAIAGLSFLREAQLVRTPPRAQIADLDELPVPAWHLFPRAHYRIFNFARVREPGVLIQGSRGCPFRCSYCSLRVMGPRRRARSAGHIADEIALLHDRFGYVQPSFVDPIFPFSKKEGLAFAHEMIARRLQREVVWITETRTDLVDEDLLRALREAGLRRVMFGFESGAQARLDALEKAVDAMQGYDAVRAARRAGVEIIGFFMLGVPGETLASMQATIDLACRLDIDFAKFTVFSPFPGTPVHDQLRAGGHLPEPENWARYTSYPTHSLPPAYVPEGLRAVDLVRAQRRAFSSFYLRPRMIARQTLVLRALDLRDMVGGVSALGAAWLGRG